MRSRRDRSVGFARACSALLLGGLGLLLVDCEFIAPSPKDGFWGPMVPHTTFPGDCGICHVAGQWNELREDFSFDHEKETGFVLVGAHARAACLRCHNDRGPVKVYVARGCGGCHVDLHKGALGQECTACHVQETWQPLGLIADHARTRFPLTAAHAIASCEGCHDRATVGDFRGAPAECHFCHQQEAGRAFPNHVINGWHRGCERCHTPANWRAEGFNHAAFPLQGGHAGLNCTQCHANGLFAGLNPACVACHLNDYVSAPNHVANNFSTDCILCHNINAWN